MSCFSHMDGKVAGPFGVFVYLSVCLHRREREFVCAYSLFGGGFLSALEVQRVWDTGRGSVWFCPPSLPQASLKETCGEYLTLWESVCACVWQCVFEFGTGGLPRRALLQVFPSQIRVLLEVTETTSCSWRINPAWWMRNVIKSSGVN